MSKTKKQTPLEEQEKNEEHDKEKELQTKIEQLGEEKLYLLAELENQRKYSWKIIEDTEKYANRKIISAILIFFADLSKALEIINQQPEDKIENHLPAIKMMQNNLWKILEKEGVKEIDIKPKVDQFNARYHEVVAKIENNEFDEGTILEVVSKGYLLHQQVLKVSQVKISKKI